MEYRRYNKRKCNVINRTAPIHPFIINQIVIVIYYFKPPLNIIIISIVIVIYYLKGLHYSVNLGESRRGEEDNTNEETKFGIRNLLVSEMKAKVAIGSLPD